MSSRATPSRRRRRTRAATGALAAATLLTLAACSSSGDTDAAAETGDCPTAPVDVVVSVDQWGDLVSRLGGDCTHVTTVIASSSVDPHDYEPTPADAGKFVKADLVVVNGADYDPWASKLAASAAKGAAVLDAGQVVGAADGANPHLWYSPDDVARVSDAVTRELETLSPDAKDYLEQQRAALTKDLAPYTDLVAKLKTEAAGRTYGATEGVFDYMAQAVGLVDKTPAGFARAAANESDPSPADLKAFQDALAGHEIDVLIDNTQTEGSIPEQVRHTAEQAGVPVVEVTETVAPGASSFEDWQVSQLTELAKALGVDA
ncbi:metal ABC transporter solute-binding protein, Zn/Mn family [Luteimicrobium sp. DT211]|uniref:metal ABC transporter solute-binding protein, Zn/Mn family n=1 Tax=Luteimicrobium sp. DT211 TaxID=3393412 RepID=UPI003CF5E56D